MVRRDRFECGRSWDSSPGRVKPKTMKMVFAVSPLSSQQYGLKAKTGWLGIRMMCPSGLTYLPLNCCFTELAR